MNSVKAAVDVSHVVAELDTPERLVFRSLLTELASSSNGGSGRVPVMLCAQVECPLLAGSGRAH